SFILSLLVFLVCHYPATTEIYTLSVHDALPILFHGAFDSLAIFFLERCGAAHQNDLHAMSFNGVIGQLSIAFSGPVTQCMAGAGADDQVLPVPGQMAMSKFVISVRERNIPAGRRGLEPQWFQKACQAVPDMLMRCGGDAPIDKQAVEVFTPGLVVADFELCRDAGRRQVCSERDLHV